MKFKKVIVGTLSVLMTISLFSIAAKAQTIGLNFRLPAYGSIDSDYANKHDTEDKAYVRINSLGWVQRGDSFTFWVVNPNGTQLTDSVSINSAGSVYNPYYYGNNGSYYCGWDLKLRMKTGTFTYHECDVTGLFTP